MTGSSASAAVAPSRGFRADIQGLRAVAVLLVVLYHAGLPWIPGGYVGVDVFFVISGFLITGHLFAEIQTTGRLQFARFYARRARRILPASFAVLVLTIAACLVFIPPALIGKFLRDAVATALYVPNFAFAVQGTDYLAETAPSPFQHYWSLGVEEQFYLLWPAFLVVVWLLFRKSRPIVVGVVTVVILASLAWSIVLTGHSQPWAFFTLPSRVWEFGIGGLVAIAGPDLARRLPQPVAATLGWLSLVLIIGSAVLFGASTAFPGSAAAVPVLGAAGVIFFGSNPVASGPVALLAVRPMQFLGLVSYSLYLLHWPLLVIPAQAGGRTTPLPLWLTLALAALAVPLAWFLYRFVETPLRTGTFFRNLRPRLVLVAAAATSAVIVAACLVAVASIGNAGVSSNRSAVPIRVLTPAPVFTRYVPSNLHPALAKATADLPLIYADGCHLEVPQTAVQKCSFGDLSSTSTVALFGDSHAAQWFPALDALAVAHHFRLEVYTKSSCPSVTVSVVAEGSRYTECTAWRAAVIAHLDEVKPSLIIISNLANYPGQPGSGITAGEWSRGMLKTLAQLPAASKKFVISDTPNMQTTPAICLSAHVDDTRPCSLPRSSAIDSAWLSNEAVAAKKGGAAVINLDDLLCNATTCGPIIGSALLYRDATHLTASFVATMAPALWVHIRQAVNAAG